MAIATKPKAKAAHHKKRQAAHHRQTKHYVKSYWPYLPMIAVLLLGVLINNALHRPTAILGVETNLTQQALLDATNTDRQDNNRPALTLNPQLQQAAQTKAADMSIQNYWSHNSPAGKQPWSFVAETGYTYQAAGENLAYGFSDADAIMNAWMKSNDHRANLLSTEYTEVGFGVTQATDFDGKGPQTIVVAMYAQPSLVTDSSAKTNAPLNAEPVSRLEASSLPAATGFAIGVVSTMAVILLLVRHSIAWRRLVNRGELFVLHHPLLDTVMVAIVVAAVILTTTVGSIQ
jgi:uncharacterized protein YkwD